MRALSKDEIFEALEEDNMGRLPAPPTIEELAALRQAALKNVSPAGNKLPTPLSDEQLAKLRDESQRLGRQLTDAEREIVLYGKVQPRFVSGIKILN
jgi:hypothetical protein